MSDCVYVFVLSCEGNDATPTAHTIDRLTHQALNPQIYNTKQKSARGLLLPLPTTEQPAAAPTTTTFHTPYYTALALLHSAPPQTALPLLLHAAKSDPTRPQAFRALGLCYRAMGERERAVKCLMRAVGLDPLDAVSGEALSALLLELQGEPSEVGLFVGLSEGGLMGVDG